MRLFLILALIQTIFLPTYSAFPDDLEAYRWERKGDDAFYRGTVTFPDGTKHNFQTRDSRLYFPSGSKILVTGYATPKRATGGRKVSRERGNDAYVSNPAPDDDLDQTSFGDTKAIVGNVDQGTRAGGESGGIAAGDLCQSIEAAARLYLGQESINAKGGLSAFKGDSVIVGTVIDWTCRLEDQWSWRAQLGRHDMRLKQKETTTSGTSERTRSYDRTSAMMAAIRRADVLEYGLGLSYARLPILKITEPTLNASQLKQQGFGVVTVLGRYAPESGLQAGLSLSPYAFDTKSFFAYAVDAGWRTLFAEKWHWDLGVRYEAASVTIDSACQDNPTCRDSAKSELTLPQGWIGMGRFF